MVTKKSETKKYPVTGTITNLDIGVEVLASSLEEALAKGKELKFNNFIQECGDVQDFDGPTLSSVWANE